MVRTYCIHLDFTILISVADGKRRIEAELRSVLRAVVVWEIFSVESGMKRS
jgi:hypothetical protein